MWGVRMITVYTLTTGLVTMMSMVQEQPLPASIPADEAKGIKAMHATSVFVKVLGTVVGCNAWLGLHQEQWSADKVYRLFVYYILMIILDVATLSYNLSIMCDVLTALHDKYRHLTCEEARYQLIQLFALNSIMHIAFAHACWSMAKRMERTPSPANFLQIEPLLGPQAFTSALGTPYAERPAVDSRPQAQQPPRGFQPFAGRSYRLED